MEMFKFWCREEPNTALLSEAQYDSGSNHGLENGKMDGANNKYLPFS